jgi:hypothetical protein
LRIFKSSLEGESNFWQVCGHHRLVSTVHYHTHPSLCCMRYDIMSVNAGLIIHCHLTLKLMEEVATSRVFTVTIDKMHCCVIQIKKHLLFVWSNCYLSKLCFHDLHLVKKCDFASSSYLFLFFVIVLFYVRKIYNGFWGGFSSS